MPNVDNTGMPVVNTDIHALPPEALAAMVVRRFRLEPRATWQGGRSWLVAFDTEQRQYVKSPKSNRTYQRFSNSTEALDFLVQLL